MKRAVVIGLVCALAANAGADPTVRRKPSAFPQAPLGTITAAPLPRPSSNPAFLGIKMVDNRVGCLVEGVTPGSAAADATLRVWDVIVAIDGVTIPNCTTLRAQIIASAPGHIARLDVRRGAERVVLEAPLSTRAEVLHRRLVGQHMDPIDVVDADDERQSYDLADLRGKTTVIGWFTLKDCVGCSAVFDRVQDALAQRTKGEAMPFVLAVSPEPQRNTTIAMAVTPSMPKTSATTLLSSGLRREFGFTSSVPLALAPDSTFGEVTIDDRDRIYFMVIDCRGVVRFVAPVAPGSDDIDAAIDEVLAATEQAEHLRIQRR